MESSVFLSSQYRHFYCPVR